MTPLDRERFEDVARRSLRPGEEALWDRFVILDEAASTQDEARVRCERKPGLMVLALSQHAGRGRLGRSWSHAPGKGVAATFVADAKRWDAATASIAAGVAACSACASALHEPPEAGTLGLRWPNDVVLRAHPAIKLAGVLIERVDDLLLIGIGINVLHEPSDFPAELCGRVTSLMQLATPDRGRELSVLHVAMLLQESLRKALTSERDTLARLWRRFNALHGRRCRFEHDGQQVEGVVIDIDPAGSIVLELDNAVRVSLPALTTSMVHDLA